MDVPSEVVVGAMSTAGVLGAAAIGALGEAIRRQARATREAVGNPNGDGTVVQMLERVLAGQAGQDNRLAKLERGQHDHTVELGRLEGRLSAVEAMSTRAPDDNPSTERT